VVATGYIAQERVRDPDGVPLLISEPDLHQLVVEVLEREAGVAPRLAQVHAHLVVLQVTRPESADVSTGSDETQMLVIAASLCPIIQRKTEKRNHFTFMNKSFNTQSILTKFSARIVSECYNRCYFIIFGTYTNFGTFLCKNCDYQSGSEIDDYRLVFIVSISLLRKILNACRN